MGLLIINIKIVARKSIDFSAKKMAGDKRIKYATEEEAKAARALSIQKYDRFRVKTLPFCCKEDVKLFRAIMKHHGIVRILRCINHYLPVPKNQDDGI